MAKGKKKEQTQRVGPVNTVNALIERLRAIDPEGNKEVISRLFHSGGCPSCGHGSVESVEPIYPHDIQEVGGRILIGSETWESDRWSDDD